MRSPKLRPLALPHQDLAYLLIRSHDSTAGDLKHGRNSLPGCMHPHAPHLPFSSRLRLSNLETICCYPIIVRPHLAGKCIDFLFLTPHTETTCCLVDISYFTYLFV
jgi:hypothetical protein